MKKGLILLLSFLPFWASAQFDIVMNGDVEAKKDILDNATIKIGYSTFSIKDTLKPDKITEDYTVLEVGSKYSKYYSDNARRRDSVMQSVMARGSSNVNFGAEFFKANNIKPGGDASVIIKNLAENKLTYYAKIGRSEYEYEDPLNEMQWKIEPDTMTILSYLCQKATMNFRGRQFEAWFTSDIPIINGPWKFHGLPGLILKVTDSKKEYRFECNEISQQSAPITYEKNNYIKVSRKEYQKLQKKHSEDPIGNIKQSMPGATLSINIMDPNGQPVDASTIKLPYNPIELN